jgi:hypothetical protein
LTLIIQASVGNDKLFFRQDSVTIGKYLALEDLLPVEPQCAKQDEAASTPRGGAEGESKRAEAAPVGQAKPGLTAPTKPSDYPRRVFRVERAFRTDLRLRIPLPSDLIAIRDASSLERQPPTERLRDRAEKRLIVVRFNAGRLMQGLEKNEKDYHNFYEAVVEQGQLRIEVSVDGRHIVPWTIRLLTELS